MDPTSKSKFEALLNDQYQWPTEYTFKFIIAKDRIGLVSALFPGESAALRPSSKGGYVSATYCIVAPNAQWVMQIYEAASKIDGLIVL